MNEENEYSKSQMEGASVQEEAVQGANENLDDSGDEMFNQNFSGTSAGQGYAQQGSYAYPGKKRGGLIFLIVVIVFALVAAVIGILNRDSIFEKIKDAGRPSLPRPEKSFGPSGIEISGIPFKKMRRSGKYIANLYIEGVIQEENESYNQKWLLDTIKDLEEDPDNMGILLVIDSPGGAVYQADETYLALRQYKNSGKPVWAYFESIAASGGYYIACAADSIYANRNTLTGSIGVIFGSSVDATGLLEKMGIKTRTFTAGKNKNMLSYNEPLTEEHIKIMQSIADECYDQFTGIVASARGKSLEEVRILADGRIYSAKQAKENGLIDSIGTLENAQERMKDKIALSQNLSADEKDALNFFDYKYFYEEPFIRRMFRAATNIQGFSALSRDPLTRAAAETVLPQIEGPAYLYKF